MEDIKFVGYETHVTSNDGSHSSVSDNHLDVVLREAEDMCSDGSCYIEVYENYVNKTGTRMRGELIWASN